MPRQQLPAAMRRLMPPWAGGLFSSTCGCRTPRTRRGTSRCRTPRTRGACRRTRRGCCRVSSRPATRRGRRLRSCACGKHAPCSWLQAVLRSCISIHNCSMRGTDPNSADACHPTGERPRHRSKRQPFCQLAYLHANAEMGSHVRYALQECTGLIQADRTSSSVAYAHSVCSAMCRKALAAGYPVPAPPPGWAAPPPQQLDGPHATGGAAAAEPDGWPRIPWLHGPPPPALALPPALPAQRSAAWRVRCIPKR